MTRDVAHEPVLVAECLSALAVKPGGRYVDGTVGLGGHAKAILDASAPDGQLIGLDRDPELLAEAARRLAQYGERARLRHASYADIGQTLTGGNWKDVDGILLDLGVCSAHLDVAERGFAFRSAAPLDMRFDRSTGSTAREWLRGAAEGEIAQVLHRYGEIARPERLARALSEAARAGRLETTADLARLARGAPGPARHHNPATRVFQAVRIAVNREIDTLEEFLAGAPRFVARTGRIAVIAYHSLEDRPVKTRFRELSQTGEWALVAKRAIKPGREEIVRNPRARSARLRAISRRDAA